MMLGWGLRGFIGGGPLGAMIPGAMVTLAICLVRGITPSARACAFGAIAIGFGGEMTYGQTVGAAVALETRAWGLLGLTVKGAVWGMLGGAVMSLGFARITPKLMAQAGVLLSVSTWVGWKLINEPKLIYFSNRLDRPREEVWAGFLLAALSLMVWLGPKQPHLLRFALWGTLGGGLGFGLGGALQAYGIEYAGRHHPWWKGMEFTFGLLLGWALAMAARQLPASDEPNPPPTPLWGQMAAAVFASLLLFGDLVTLPLRFGFLVLGTLVLWILTLYPAAAWQVSLTVTIAATVVDLAELRKGPHNIDHYGLAITAALLLSIAVVHVVRDAASALLWLTWATTAIATTKYIKQGSGPENIVGISFILMAIAVTWMTVAGGTGIVPPQAELKLRAD